MAKQRRIFVVEDDETLHRHVVNALRKDGYNVQGANNKRDAVRALWAEEYDAVVCDLKASTSDDIELLQWIRAYRPGMRVILFGEPDEASRAFALESGAASYMDRPLDLYRLKVELHRLLTQTGFSASLDSFDLLDVIQIISASRKNIALLVNTGLEERGMLCFQEGSLVWAEYGMLRGEEAFFALAAHKNGTVIHQPWNQRIAPNVTQPLSRLILQALTYRTKYARQMSDEHAVVSTDHLELAMPQHALQAQAAAYEVDDTPFLFALEEGVGDGGVDEAVRQEQTISQPQQLWMERNVGVQEMTLQKDIPDPSKQKQEEALKEWWQQTGKMLASDTTPRPQQNSQQQTVADTTEGAHLEKKATSHFPRTTVPITPIFEKPLSDSSGIRRVPPGMRKTHMRGSGEHDAQGGQHTQERGEQVRNTLPSWLTDQPTSAGVRAFSPPSEPASMSPVPQTPVVRSSQQPSRNAELSPQVPQTPKVTPAEWQAPVHQEIELRENSGELTAKMQVRSQEVVQPSSSPEWQAIDEAEETDRAAKGGPLSDVTASRLATRSAQTNQHERVRSDATGRHSAMRASEKDHTTGRGYDYSALASPLQTLGYSVMGFIASAVVTLDGRPLAHVAIHERDIAPWCQSLSQLARSSLQLLQLGGLGEYEDTVLTSNECYIFLRLIRNRSENETMRQRDVEAFQVLITTRKADVAECIGLMASVEDAMATVLYKGA